MSRTLIGATVLIALAAVFVTGCAQEEQAQSAIGVNALTADPQAFTGQVTVEGIVQDVDADASTLRLIDVAEFETCGITPCAGAGVLALSLPLDGEPSPAGFVYEGELPQVQDLVVVTLEVYSEAGEIRFDAQSVTRDSVTIISRR